MARTRPKKARKVPILVLSCNLKEKETTGHVFLIHEAISFGPYA